MKRLTACLVALVAVACSAQPAPVDSTGEPKRPRSQLPDAPPFDPNPALVYVKNDSVRAYQLKTGDDILMRSVPGPDVALSLDGQHLAIVTDKKPGEDPEGLADPYIGVATTMGEGQVTEIGPGRSPHWSADAARIAAITDDGIVSYDVGSGASTPVLEGAVWSLFGWSGPEVGAVGLDGASLTTPGSEPRYLDLDPSTVWGISPTDGTVLTIDQATATVIRGEQETDISMEGGLGDGAWDPDGSVIVAVIIGTGTTIGVIDTVTATIRYEAEGVGAQGNVVWSADSKRFAFVRIAPNDRLKLQAVVCTLEGECEPAFSWARGVSLLGFTEI